MIPQERGWSVKKGGGGVVAKWNRNGEDGDCVQREAVVSE